MAWLCLIQFQHCLSHACMGICIKKISIFENQPIQFGCRYHFAAHHGIGLVSFKLAFIKRPFVSRIHLTENIINVIQFTTPHTNSIANYSQIQIQTRKCEWVNTISTGSIFDSKYMCVWAMSIEPLYMIICGNVWIFDFINEFCEMCDA